MRSLSLRSLIILFLFFAVRAFSQDCLQYSDYIHWLGQVELPASGGPAGITVVDGFAYCANSEAGLVILDVSDPIEMVLISTTDTPGLAFHVAVKDNYAFVTDESAGLQVIDISDVFAPEIVANCPLPGRAIWIDILGETAFVAADYEGLQVVDISNPLAPVIISNADTYRAIGIDVDGDYAYVGAGTAGLKVVDIADPYTPLEVGAVDTPGESYRVVVEGNYVYIADSDAGLVIVEITNPTMPSIVSIFDTPGYVYGVAICGTVVLATDEGGVGLQLLDVSNPSTPLNLGTLFSGNGTTSVFASDSLAIVGDVTNGVLSLTLGNNEAVTPIGHVDTPDWAFEIEISGDYGYIADGEGELQVADISMPTNPFIVSNVSTQHVVYGLSVYENYVYLASGYSGLQIVDIADPHDLEVVGSIDTPEVAYSVAVNEACACVADGGSGLQIIDVTNPTSPQIVSVVPVPSAFRVTIDNQKAFVVNRADYFGVVDISTPSNPSIVGEVSLPSGAFGVVVKDDYAYVGCGYSGLVVIDISDPEVPRIVASVDTPGISRRLAIEDKFVYLADSAGGLQVIDVSDPESPARVGNILGVSNSQGVAIYGEYVVVADATEGIQVVPAQCGRELTVSPDGLGDYATIQEAIDAIAVSGVVLLDEGVFSGFGNVDLDYQGKGIRISSMNADASTCIIDCQGTESEPHRGFLFQSGETSEAVIEGITIMGGYADEGGAIKCESGSSPTIRNCILRDNYATSGGAVFSDSSSPAFENCTISYNASPTAGAAYLLYSDPTFENCILSNSYEGFSVFGYESSPVLSCTDVVWNEGGDWVGCIADQQNQNGNFSNTPAFCEPESGDFRLQPGSPCLPAHNSCGVLVGALGEGDCLPTGVEGVPTADRVALSAYPNPFNPHLTIMFSLPADANGSLTVHDVSGRQVRVLKDGQFTQGTNEIVWNGQDDHGREVASGVYFVRLVTEEYQESKKVVLLR